MNELTPNLFNHLLEALRRDFRRETLACSLANPGSETAFFHGFNARLSCEVLQALNPKRPRKAVAAQKIDADSANTDKCFRRIYSVSKKTA